jgi:hypothetical protein
MNFYDWFTRGYKPEVIATLLGDTAATELLTSGSKEPTRRTATATAAPAPDDPIPDVHVTARIPPLAQYGSYDLHEGVDVYIDPPPGKKICETIAEEWLMDQWDYYDTYVVTGDPETSTGATRANFDMVNVKARENGFSFRFAKGNHTAGMPYAQLATFIEIMKEVPIIEVNTAKLETLVKEELRYANDF